MHSNHTVDCFRSTEWKQRREKKVVVVVFDWCLSWHMVLNSCCVCVCVCFRSHFIYSFFIFKSHKNQIIIELKFTHIARCVILTAFWMYSNSKEKCCKIACGKQKCRIKYFRIYQCHMESANYLSFQWYN